MSEDYSGYNPLKENGCDSSSRPGLVYVTTKTPSENISMSKVTKSNDYEYVMPKSDQTVPKSSPCNGTDHTPVDEGEPQCEIIVHTDQAEPPPPPYASDHFSLSLFVTLCCCLPFGIVGLVKNHESRVKAVAGDYDGAVLASRIAHRYAIAGCVIGTVGYTAYSFFALAVLVMTMMGTAY